MILFAGDSFSAYNDKESWTYFFAQKKNLEFKNLSISCPCLINNVEASGLQ